MRPDWKAFWRGVGSVFDLAGTQMLSGRSNAGSRPRRAFEDDAWASLIPHECDDPACEGYVRRKRRW